MCLTDWLTQNNNQLTLNLDWWWLNGRMSNAQWLTDWLTLNDDQLKLDLDWLLLKNATLNNGTLA